MLKPSLNKSDKASAQSTPRLIVRALPPLLEAVTISRRFEAEALTPDSQATHARVRRGCVDDRVVPVHNPTLLSYPSGGAISRGPVALVCSPRHKVQRSALPEHGSRSPPIAALAAIAPHSGKARIRDRREGSFRLYRASIAKKSLLSVVRGRWSVGCPWRRAAGCRRLARRR